MPELSAYKGNSSHGTEGIHLGYWDKEKKRLIILCGLSTENKRQCRCMPWWPVPDTKLTCQECHDKGKEMHDEAQ